METRPKIQLRLSLFDISLERCSVVMLLLLWGLAGYTFLVLPAIVPIHFNASGEPDRYGSKTVLLFLPLLATGIYIALTFLNKHPEIFNYGTKITTENAERQYSLATRTLRFIKLAVLIVFGLIILFTYLTSTGVTNGMGVWFIPIVLALFLIPTFISIRNSLRAS